MKNITQTTPTPQSASKLAKGPLPRDFRLFLQEELLRRCKSNPAYSMRAFARALQVDYSTLAKILKGQRKLGAKAILRMAGLLSLTPQEIEFYTTCAKSKKSGADSTDSETYQQLTLDSFQIISDWYHYAILELMRVDHFQPDSIWVAKALGLTISEVNIAMERLCRVGILEITPRGDWIDHSEGRSTTLGSEFTASAFRILQKQVLLKAVTALEEIPLAQRDQTSMTLAIDTQLLPEAKRRITQFRRELSRFLSRGDRRDEVYHLGISLYPVSQSRSVSRKEVPVC